MKLNLLSLAVCAVCAAAAMPASAVTEGRAGVDSLSYTLTDLDLSDGIAPSLTFVPNGGGSILQAYFEYPGESKTVGAGETASVTSTGPQSSAVAAISSNGGPFNGTSFSATGWADGSIQGDDTTPGFSASLNSLLRFNLSPNTLLTFGGVALTSASVLEAWPSGYASSDLTLKLSGDGVSNHGEQAERLSLDARASYDPNNSYAHLSQVRDQAFSLKFANLSAQEISGALSIRASTWGYEVSPVPEPATWALWMGGLGLMGAAARRRAAR